LCLSLLDQNITLVRQSESWKFYFDQGLIVILGETSVQHTYQKLSIIRSVITSMKPFGTTTILLVVANPVDLFTSFIHGISGLPESRVIGSGSWLDSIRVSSILAEKAKVSSEC
jgi:L-lactate dehydrogenase